MQGDVFRKPRHAWEAQNALRSTCNNNNNNYKVGLDLFTGLLKDTLYAMKQLSEHLDVECKIKYNTLWAAPM